MVSEAAKRASATLKAKREAEGYRKVTLWLHEDTRGELERLAKVYGSKDKAAAVAIDHHQVDEHPTLSLAEIARLTALLKPGLKVRVRDDDGPGFVPLMVRKPFNPQPKTGKK